MKKLIILLLLLALSVWLALKIKSDPGYLLIAYQDYVIDMPLWVGVFLMAIAFFGFYWLWRIIREIYFTPRHVVDWYKQKTFERIRRRTARGFIALVEGRWQDAQQLLSKNIDKRHTALLNCLGAAIAAQKQGKELERDEYLRLAHSYHSHADIAIGLTQARLQYMQGQFEQCLASLRRLLLIDPEHATLLEMLKTVLIDLKAWHELLDLLKILQKKKLISTIEAEHLKQQAYVALFIKAKSMGGDAPAQLWQTLTEKWMLNAELLLQYVPYLLARGEDETVEQLIKKSLKKNWDPRLVRYYGLCNVVDKDKQLKIAQAWLKQYSEDPVLLMTLGRLMSHAEIWGLSKDYLQKSLAILPVPETYLLLGDLFVKLQDQPKSQQYYQLGLKLVCQLQP